MEDSSFLDLLQDAYKDVVLGIYTREDMINYNGEKILGSIPLNSEEAEITQQYIQYLLVTKSED